MSRAFRDAFTKLLCASFISNNQQRLQSIATPLLAKQSDGITNNKELRNSHIRASTVILNSTTNEIPMTSLTPRTSYDIKKYSMGSLEQTSVLFSEDDINQPKNI